MNAAQFFDHWYKVWRDLLIAVDLLQGTGLDPLRDPAQIAGLAGD